MRASLDWWVEFSDKGQCPTVVHFVHSTWYNYTEGTSCSVLDARTGEFYTNYFVCTHESKCSAPGLKRDQSVIIANIVLTRQQFIIKISQLCWSRLSKLTFRPIPYFNLPLIHYDK